MTKVSTVNERHWTFQLDRLLESTLQGKHVGWRLWTFPRSRATTTEPVARYMYLPIHTVGQSSTANLYRAQSTLHAQPAQATSLSPTEFRPQLARWQQPPWSQTRIQVSSPESPTFISRCFQQGARETEQAHHTLRPVRVSLLINRNLPAIPIILSPLRIPHFIAAISRARLAFHRFRRRLVGLDHHSLEAGSRGCRCCWW